MLRSMVILALGVLALTSLASAADPPDGINYQGVLRDNADEPLDGSFPMTFRFFDALTGGNEILVDTHGAVTVSNGLFNVEIGSGSVTDGSGPGTFTTLTDAFAQSTDLHLEVEVSGETLSPRTPVAAAGYALNARRVRGVELVSDGPLDLYVDGSFSGCGGGGCSDSNDGLSLGTAKQTIQAAVNSIPLILRGDATIHVADGTYNESIVVGAHSRQGLFSITIVGNNLDRNLVVLDGENTRDNAIFTLDDSLVVSWMTIQNYEEAIAVQEASLNLEHCALTDNTDAGLFVFSGESQLVDCVIGAGNAVGISVVQGRVSLSDCQITSNTGDGVHLESSIMWLEGALSISSNLGWDVLAENHSIVDFNGLANCSIQDPMLARDHSTILEFGNCASAACVTEAALGDPDPTGDCDP